MNRPSLTMIVAASENDVIGVNDDLPWKLSSDLKRFKRLTTGHAILMGRKTFDSIGRLLPNRKTIIITRNEDYAFEGAHVVHSIESAIELCSDDQRPYLVGGAEIYRQAMPLVDEIQLTRVHVQLDGDTFLPDIDWNQWTMVNEETFPADEKNEYPYSFQHFQRVAG